MQYIKENFIHFDEKQQCIDFIKFYEINFRKKITSICCEGKGCALQKSSNEINKIRDDFLSGYIYPIVVHNNIIGDCDICYEQKELVTLCKTCNHPFCMDCIRQIQNNNCAYCRSYIDFIVT